MRALFINRRAKTPGTKCSLHLHHRIRSKRVYKEGGNVNAALPQASWPSRGSEDNGKEEEIRDKGGGGGRRGEETKRGKGRGRGK